MIIILIILALVCSFTIHLLALVIFILTKNKNYFNIFIATSLSNVIIGMTLSIIALQKPQLIRSIDLKMVLWTISGFIMFMMLSIKIFVFRKVYKRSRDSNFYHYNYFGKKVYEKGIIKKYEFAAILISIPFFLIFGAYFIALLVNLIRFGSL